MRRPRWRLAGVLIAGWLAVSAHVVVTVETGGSLIEARWPGDALIEISLWEGLTSALGSVDDSVDGPATIRAALETWLRVSEVTVLLKTTPQRTLGGGPDGVNLVTLPQAGSPDAALLASGVLATTVVEMTAGGEILEADILFSPQPGTVWTTDETVAGGRNLLATARHEFGHLFNMAHSPQLDATMYFRSGHFPYALNALSWDDIAGLNRAADGPHSHRMVGLEEITGSISGQVSRFGADIFGAVVVACDADGLSVASGISLPDGSYRIENLPAGLYTLYAQPLSGPTTPDEISGGVFDALPPADFQPQFYEGSSAPNVAVTAGAETIDIDFKLQAGAPATIPSQVGADTNINDGFTTSAFSAAAAVDSETNVIVAGTGFDAVNTLTLLGVQLQQTAFLGNVVLGDQVTPAALFKVDVGAGAPRGPYPLLPRTDDEIAPITGGLEVVHPLRFETAFAHFIDFPALGGVRVFLLNPALAGPPGAGSIDIRDGAGAAAEIDLPGSPFSLPPGGSATLQSQSGENFIGSARARADGPLGGAVLFDTAVGITGVGPSRPGHRLLAPVVIVAAEEVDTGLALTNLDDRTATVRLSVRDKGGVEAASAIVEVAGAGHLAGFVRELVAGVPADFVGTLLITSTRPLGAVIIRTAPGLFTTFPVVQNHSLDRLDFAHFVHVPNLFSSEVILLNPSSRLAATGVVVEFRDAAGSPRPLTLNGATAEDGRFEVDDIPPLGCVVLTGGGNSELIGALRVTGSVPLGGVVLFTSDDFGTTGVGASASESAFASVISQDIGNQIGTGFAVSNPDAAELDLEITARSPTGQIAGGPVAVTVPAHGHLARFTSEDLNGSGGNLGLPAAFEGSLWIRSIDGRPFAATILRQTLAPGSLTTFPAIGTRPLIVPAR